MERLTLMIKENDIVKYDKRTSNVNNQQIIDKLGELEDLQEKNLIYRKVFLIKNECHKSCNKDCTKCIKSSFVITNIIIDFSNFDEKKHYSTKEEAQIALDEIYKKLKPLYEKIEQSEPEEIEWHGQGHEVDGYCPTCDLFLGSEIDLTYKPIVRCPRCRQLFKYDDD